MSEKKPSKSSNKASTPAAPTESGAPASQPRAGSQALTQSTPSLKTPQSDNDQARAVADLLNGSAEPAKQEEQPETEHVSMVDDVLNDTDDQVEAAPDPVPLKKVKSLKDLADNSGLDIDSIYAMEITTADGEKATLSEMKDYFSQRQEEKRENAEAAARRDEQETADIANRTFVADLAARFGHMLTPDQQAEMQAQRQQTDARERDLLAQTAPELSNPQTFTAFRDDAVTLLKMYGYTPAEMQISDHRQILMMRDMMKMRKRLKDLGTYKPKSKPPGNTSTSGKIANIDSSTRANAAAAKGSEADKVAAISRIMKG